MPPTFDAPRIVSLGSGIAWWAVGFVPVIRTRLASRLERGLAATAFLLGGWAFLDAIYPVVSGASPDLGFPVALHRDARDPARRGRLLPVGEHLRDIDDLVRRAVVRVLPPDPGDPHPGGDSSAVGRRLGPRLPGGVRHPGARHRDLHVLPHRGAPRRPRVDP